MKQGAADKVDSVDKADLVSREEYDQLRHEYDQVRQLAERWQEFTILAFDKITDPNVKAAMLIKLGMDFSEMCNGSDLILANTRG